MRKQLTSASALILAATLAIPSRSLAITPIAMTMAMAETSTESALEAVSKVDEAGAYPAGENPTYPAAKAENYPAEKKSTYPTAETALAPSGYEKTSTPVNHLPWWRWLTLTPVFLIFFWSILNDPNDYTQEASDESSAN